MTANRRIFLNIVATYGRSLYALAIGLVTARWTLMALGAVDYGLVGVVGGLTTFISFVNALLAAAISRFYAYSVGQASVSEKIENGLEECRRWFSVAVLVHTVVPVLLICVGYPIGMWAVEHFLTIPIDRVADCRWVFRFVCVSCFVGMLNVPFAAMYTAKQYIAELTVYSFVTTTLNAFFMYYMVTHPGVWIVKYSAWTCGLSVLPQLLICLRAIVVFPECRFRLSYCWSWLQLKQLTIYAFWHLFGSLGGLARGQGMAILVNKYFGPAINATMAMANSVGHHTETLATAVYGAVSPAVIQSAGAGQKTQMLKLAYRGNKICVAACLLFMVPLVLEADYVMKLWLREPPFMMAEAAILAMTYMLLGQLNKGIDIVIIADGRVGKFMFRVGCFMILTLPVAWLIIHCWHGSFLTCLGVMIAFRMFAAFITLPLAKRQTGFSPSIWIFHVVIPMCLVAVFSLVIGLWPRLFLLPSFMRLVLSALSSVVSVAVLSWFLAFEAEERNFVLERISFLVRKLKQNIGDNQ